MLHPTQIPLQDLTSEIVVDHVPVLGKLPGWLEGTLIRNGPARFHFGDQQITHWFDGMAMLHSFRIKDGMVSYRNRFIRSEAFTQATTKNDLKFWGFAQDPCYTVFWRFFSQFFPSFTRDLVQNANVNVARIAGQYAALTETPLPVHFNPHTLETLGPLEYQDSLLKKECFESAHPHHDSKEMISFQIGFGRKCTYTFYTVSDDGEAVRKPFFTMKVDKASYVHSFALTKQYVILVEYPLLLKPLDLLLKGGGYITQFHWEPNVPVKFHVIDRHQGKLIKTFETEAFFCFHQVNAFEADQEIIVDLIRHPDAEIVFGYPAHDHERSLTRYRLNVATGSIKQQVIAKTLLELPRIHYQKCNTKPYQYVYGVGFHYPESPAAEIPLIKIDVHSGAIQEWSEEGALAGEPVFVPSPAGDGEDDGILLSVVTNELRGSSYLLVLDAKTLQEIARATISQRIPYGLHGMFYSL
jgi:beta,beta-carotene 9',10'-dioxygenase